MTWAVVTQGSELDYASIVSATGDSYGWRAHMEGGYSKLARRSRRRHSARKTGHSLPSLDIILPGHGFTSIWAYI